MPARRVIAIDLGGTQLRAALFAEDKLVRRAALPTDVKGGPAGVFEQIGRLIDEIRGSETSDGIIGVGMSCAGPIDTDSGTVTRIPTLPGWDGLPLARELGEHVGLPARVENDGIAAALGEWRHGAGRGVDNMVYLTVSTGIGGGAIADGGLVHGHRGMAAHIGHMRLAQDGPRCNCGTIGCFEALAAGTALQQRAAAAAQDGSSPFLAKVAQAGDPEARHVFDGARAGDGHCRKLIAEEAMYLGQGITSAIHMFSPERVIMGGGLSNGFDLLGDGIHKVIQSEAMPPFRTVPVVRAALGGDSGLWGAASMVLQPKGS
ncbi:MAG: ROK family protein [Candidatus Puniceispirillaceae bacterium]